MLAHCLHSSKYCFIIYLCDGHYLVCLINEVDNKNENVGVKFMHPHFPHKAILLALWRRSMLCENLHLLCRIESSFTRTIQTRIEDINTIEGEYRKEDAAGEPNMLP